MKLLGLLISLCVLTGCTSPPVVKDAKGNKWISTARMTCNKPYKLSKDCSIWTGATRKIVIDGMKVKIAGSESGTEVLVMGVNLIKNQLADHFKGLITKNPDHPIFQSPRHSQASNQSYHAIKRALEAENIPINKVTPVLSLGTLHGYVLELGGDGYKKLTEYSAK